MIATGTSPTEAASELRLLRCQRMLTFMRTSLGPDDADDVFAELTAVADAKRELARREEVAVRRARHTGLSWAQIGTLLGVTRQTMHRKYRKVG